MNAASAVTPPSPATLADLLALPEEDRYELIDGELVAKEAAKPIHGVAQSRTPQLLRSFNRKPGPPNQPGGWWFMTEVDVYFDPRNTFLPDVAGWRREHLPDIPAERPIRVRPDWTCEILSTNKRNDLVKKKRVYHQAQVPFYWIIDPAEELLTVHKWSPEGYTEVLLAQRGERVRAQPFEAIELQVGVLFGDDED